MEESRSTGWSGSFKVGAVRLIGYEAVRLIGGVVGDGRAVSFRHPEGVEAFALSEALLGVWSNVVVRLCASVMDCECCCYCSS